MADGRHSSNEQSEESDHWWRWRALVHQREEAQPEAGQDRQGIKEAESIKVAKLLNVRKIQGYQGKGRVEIMALSAAKEV